MKYNEKEWKEKVQDNCLYKLGNIKTNKITCGCVIEKGIECHHKNCSKNYEK